MKSNRLCVELLLRLEELREVEAKRPAEASPELPGLLKRELELEQKLDVLIGELELAGKEGAALRKESIRKRMDHLSVELEETRRKMRELKKEQHMRGDALSSCYSVPFLLEHWDNQALTMRHRQQVARALIQHVVVGDRDISVVFY